MSDVVLNAASVVRHLAQPGIACRYAVAPGMGTRCSPGAARHSMSLHSAISARAHMRFRLAQRGGVDAVVFIEFPKRLMAGAKREILLLAGRGPAHIVRKTRAVTGSLNRKPRLLYLPPYSPDRNPGALAWEHLKAGTVGCMVGIGRDGVKRKVLSTRRLQNHPGKIISVFPETFAQIRRLNVPIVMNFLLPVRMQGAWILQG